MNKCPTVIIFYNRDGTIRSVISDIKIDVITVEPQTLLKPANRADFDATPVHVQSHFSRDNGVRTREYLEIFGDLT